MRVQGYSKRITNGWIGAGVLCVLLSLITPATNAALPRRGASISGAGAQLLVWSPTGAPHGDLLGHRLILLQDGRAMAVGGRYSVTYELPFPVSGWVSSALAEIYDPATGQWHKTSSMPEGRDAHSATLLQDGRILVAGGLINIDEVFEDPLEERRATATAVIYDPATEVWQETGIMHAARSGHTATLLPDGTVLVAGGGAASDPSAETYDPATGTWAITGAMMTNRSAHTAVRLRTGSVFVSGGFPSSAMESSELYNPTSGAWMPAAAMATPRAGHTATLLTDGSVLVAGGQLAISGVASTERYDPDTNQWRSSGDLAVARGHHEAALLPNGDVLIAGGTDWLSMLVTHQGSERYLAAENRWINAPPMRVPRAWFGMTALPDGTILAAGGATADRFGPPPDGVKVRFLPLVR